MEPFGKPPDLDNKFSIGSKIGNFKIVEKIGSGGIGAVYKAHHKILNYLAAIKIHQHFADNEVVIVAFLQAANYLSQLNHPNIIRLYDYGFAKGHGYMAMEYIEGHTLDKIIPRTQTKNWIRSAGDFFVQLLSAVRHAHNSVYLNLAGEQVEGIIHGDIKPQNVFITRDDSVVKLSDFMIPDVQEFLGQEIPDFEKLLQHHVQPLTPEEKVNLVAEMNDESTAVFGTPKYMPPEQQEGRVSIRTDIFSLGATLYEMITNQPPMSLFDGVIPTKINPFVPKWMEDAIIKAMEHDPSKRFFSVAEMESVFRKHITKPSTDSINIIVKELLMGDKIDVKMGDISNVSGQIFIGKFNEVIANLNNSGQTEFAEALKALKEAVMASANIPEDKKKEHIEVVNQIGEEAAKENPNKTLLKIMGDGLLSVLKAIPDVAKAVNAVTPFF